MTARRHPNLSHWFAAVAVLLCLSFSARADALAPVAPKAKKLLTEADALALLTGKLQETYVKDRGQLELSFTQPWVAPTLPDEPLTVKILEIPTAGVTPSFIIRFQLCTTNQTVGTWQASMQAHIWHDVWVAHSDLQRGELVSEADVTRERRDVLSVSESLADFSPTDTSLEFANQMRAGGILLARNLKPRTVMHRGQMANAVLEDGVLSITMKVEVLEDGAVGQVVRATNPVSKRYLSGKIIDEKTILVSL
jgi:flagella basal body P-ring formation protein FlgA